VSWLICVFFFQCKYDFCWVCLEQWKRHNSSTGGYFKCNRYEAVKKVEEQAAELLADVSAIIVTLCASGA
jgi:hypothetical protein